MPRIVLAALVVPVALSCATSSPVTPPGAGTRTEEAALVGPPQVAWADMTRPQRGKYMKEVVTPKMKALFQAYDPDQFATFGCKTCHGKDAKARHFEMPAPDLPTLPATQAAFHQLALEQPQVMKFMGEQVKPQMAALLGLEEENPQSPKPNTFGCSNCHVVAEGAQPQAEGESAHPH